VILSFLNTEPADEVFYAENLPGHTLEFVSRLEAVSEEAELVCVFLETRIDAAFLEAHPRLRCVVTRSRSVDHIDLNACQARGITVLAVPAYGTDTVAEHTFALMLALARRLREIMTLPKSGRFSYEATRGMELRGKTLGILGLGRIGQGVARLARGFGMRVLAFDPAPIPGVAEELGLTYVSFEILLRECQILTLHTALTTATYHLLDRAAFAKCRPGVLIINTARGALIDTEALREGLESGHIAGAGLDVLEDERVLRDSASHIISAEIIKKLRGDDCADEPRDAARLREMQELMLGDAVLSKRNVVFTPHVAFNTVESLAHLRQGTLENIQAFVSGAHSSRTLG
jgi:D-lactate dehydrogenase